MGLEKPLGACCFSNIGSHLMIKTPLSTVIGGAFWTPSCTVIGGQQSFSQLIKKLFANGEQGFAYDPDDLSTMYQDAAGTVLVTAVGQPVGLIRDKSGRNNHAFQTNSASRPILRKNAVTGANYLEFDGSDDFLQANSIDFTATDKVSLFTGVRRLSDAGVSIIAEFSANSGLNTNSFYLVALSTGALQFNSRGSGNSATTSSQRFPAPASVVISSIGDISGKVSKIRANSGGYAVNVGDQGAGNYGNYPLYIGRRGGTALPFNGHIYGLIGIGKLVSGSETTAIEKALAKRIGVTLNA